MEDLLQQIADFQSEYESDVLGLAQELRGQKMPELTEELFSEFERNGNRLRYEAAYFGRRKFLSVFGLACVVKPEARNMEKLEEILLEICGEECWALPAHVDRKGNPLWRITIDLFASETAQTLAELVTLLGDRLSEPVTETVKREVEARVLAPFLASRAPYAGWERSGSNWNAVCCGNIGSAGLYLLEDGAERRALAERLAHALKDYYLKGFGEDGACEEGLGYWAYGFTYYMLFARQLREAYPDLDLMAGKKVEAVACFQQKCYFSGGRTVSFSDGNCFEPYPMGLTCSLACEFDSVRFPSPAYARRLGQDTCWRWAGVYGDWYWTGRLLEAVQEENGSEQESSPKLPQPLAECGGEVFPDVQWAFLRGACGSAVCVKGGHNGESHNHNDVGSFLYLADGEAFLDDLGCGEYTKDYFSDRRYTIFCNRGAGHNIPLIDSCDQCAGREYGAEGFGVPVEGTVVVRFEAAYGLSYLKRLERRLYLDKATGELTVTDEAEADRVVEFVENLITRLPVTVEDGQIVIHGQRHRVRIVRQGVQEENIQGGEHPVSPQETGEKTVQGRERPVSPQETGEKTVQGREHPVSPQETGEKTAQGGERSVSPQETGEDTAQGGIIHREVRHVNHQGDGELVHVLQWRVPPRETSADSGLYRSVFRVFLES